MQVNFTGIKNIGGFSETLKNPPQGNEQDEDDGINLTKLVFQLDNKGNDDLRQCADVFARYPDENHLGFLNLQILTTKEDYKKDMSFMLNNKPVEITNEELPILSKVLKLVTRIEKSSSSEYVLNKDYLEGSDALNNLFEFDLIQNTFKTKVEKQKIKNYFLDKAKAAHTHEMAVKIASKLNNQTQEIMMDYFA